MDKIRVLLADDHVVVRMGLASIISFEDDLEVVAEADSGDEAVSLASRLRPDVIVMDLMMPGLSGAQATADILAENPDAKILVLTTFPGSADLAFALQAGARGALVKTSSQDAILDAIRDVAAGKRVFGEGVVLPQAERTDDTRLTKRQCEILSLAAHGLTSRDIAATLGIAYETVKDNLKKIFLALDASTRAEAVSKALVLGLISG